MKLNELLPFSEHESVDIDYKLHLDKNNPKSWAKSIVAFSNGEGGRLAIGADNDGNVVGVSAALRIADSRSSPSAIASLINSLKLSTQDSFQIFVANQSY